MIIRLGIMSEAGVILIALMVLSPCAMGNATTERPESKDSNKKPNAPPTDNGNDQSAVAKYGVLQDSNTSDHSIDDETENDWNAVATPEGATIKKRHLSTLARDGDMAARRLHRNIWWDQVGSRGEDDPVYSGLLKRTLASMARQGDSAARRIHYENKRYPDDPEQSFDEDDVASQQAKRNLASMARLGNDAARRINYQTRSWGEPQPGGDDLISDWTQNAGSDNFHAKRNLASLARHGDAAARRLGGYEKRFLEEEPEYEVEYEEGDDVPAEGKRSLATLARQGDAAARRLHRSRDAVPVPLQEDAPSKRHLASLARTGTLKSIGHQQPKRQDDGSSLEDAEEDDEVIVSDLLQEDTPPKRGLGSLARDGTLKTIWTQGKNPKRQYYGYAPGGSLRKPEEDGLNAPIYHQEDFLNKRGLGSLARDGTLKNLWTVGKNTKRQYFGDASGSPWGEPEEDDASAPISLQENFANKRGLGSLARDGTLKTMWTTDKSSKHPKRQYYGDVPGGSWGDLEADEDEISIASPLQEDVPAKRNLGSLARDGTLKTIWTQSKNPKRQYYGDEGSWEEPEEDDEEPMAVVKKHIAALARSGSLINLRYQRRPLPANWYRNGGSYEAIRSNGGFKRNIQSLARTSPVGSGFRSWHSGRFWSPSEPLYQFNGRPSSRSQERPRGVRSTREGRLEALPRSPAAWAYRPSYYRNYDAFRAPMAFTSRHMFKRASSALYGGKYAVPEDPEDGKRHPVNPKEHHEDPARNSTVELPNAAADTITAAYGTEVPQVALSKPQGQRAGLGGSLATPKNKH